MLPRPAVNFEARKADERTEVLRLEVRHIDENNVLKSGRVASGFRSRSPHIVSRWTRRNDVAPLRSGSCSTCLRA
jgi:hypothetical protein